MGLRIVTVWVLACVFCNWSEARADEPKLQLGERGKLLLEEKFDSSELKDGAPSGWTKNTGHLAVVDGQLRVNEVAADKHAAALRYRLPVQDCAVAFDFRLGKTKLINFGYDPAPGELKKKGHLFSIVVKPDSWSLIEHIDKADPKSKNKVLKSAKIDLQPDKTYTLVVETRGDRVLAHIADVGSIEGSSSDFHVKKPGLVFRVSGDENAVASIDNVRVWELR